MRFFYTMSLALSLSFVQCSSEKHFDRDYLESCLDTAHTLANLLDDTQKTIHAHLIAIDLGRVALHESSHLLLPDEEAMLEQLQELNTSWNLHLNQVGTELDLLGSISQTLIESIRIVDVSSRPTPAQWESYHSIAPTLEALQNRMTAMNERIALSREATQLLIASDPIFAAAADYLEATE